MSVAVFIQHAKRTRPVLFSTVACLAVPHFAALAYKEHDFRKKIMECEMCVRSSQQLLYAKFRILKRIQRDELHGCTVHQEYQTFYFPSDAHKL